MTAWTSACQASLSFTISWSLLKLISIELVMPSNHLILCRPLLLLPSIFPSIRSFPINQLFALGGQSPHFLHIVGSLHRQQGSSSCLIKLISLMYFLPEAHHTLLVLRTPGSTSGLHVGATLYSKTAKKSSKMQKKKMRYWIDCRRDAYLGYESWNQKTEHPSGYLSWTSAWILWQCLSWHGNSLGVYQRR